MGLLKAADRPAQVLTQAGEVVGPTVREGVVQIVPHELVGIEVGGVSGKPLDSEPEMPLEEGLDLGTIVDGPSVPQQDDGTGDMAQEMLEEPDDLLHGEVFLVELHVQSHPAPTRRHRERGDDRDLIPLVVVTQDRSLPDRGPGLPQIGDEEETALVEEGEMGAQPPGLFSTAGHLCRFQRSILTSSRSTARRSGFCQLQFMDRKSGPT